MDNSLILNGWSKVSGDEDAECGPVLLEGEILANWEKADLAGDLIELVRLLCGDGVYGIFYEIYDRIISASIHVKGPRQRKADIWITLNYDDDCFDGIYVKENVFVSPEVREMIEVAAIGKED